jgi:hypothetical protein
MRRSRRTIEARRPPPAPRERERPAHGAAPRLRDPESPGAGRDDEDRTPPGPRRDRRGPGAGGRGRQAQGNRRPGGPVPGGDEPGHPGPDHGSRGGCHVGRQGPAGRRLRGELRFDAVDQWRRSPRDRGHPGWSLRPVSLPMGRHLYHLQSRDGGFDQALDRHHRRPLRASAFGAPGSELEDPDRYPAPPGLRAVHHRPRPVLSTRLRRRGRAPPRGQGHVDMCRNSG